MRSADELEKGEKENVKLLSDGAFSPPHRRRRVIGGTCLVILAFAVFTWLSIYFGALNSEVKNGDVVVWTEERRLRVKMSAETRGGGGSWHDVILKQADCRIDGTALSEDASTGATVDFLKIRMDFKNFMLVQRQRSSEERSAVEVDVSEVDFNAAWELVQAIQKGDLRIGLQCSATLDVSLYGVVQVNDVRVKRSHHFVVPAVSSQTKGHPLYEIRRTVEKIREIMVHGAAAADSEEGADAASASSASAEEEEGSSGWGLLKVEEGKLGIEKVTFDAVMGYTLRFALPLRLADADTISSLTAHVPAFEVETAVKFGEGAGDEDWRALGRADESYAMRYILGMEATTWTLRATAQAEEAGEEESETAGGSAHAPEASSTAAPSLVVYARASCSASEVVPCAADIGEEAEWVSEHVLHRSKNFTKPALDWLRDHRMGATPEGAVAKAAEEAVNHELIVVEEEAMQATAHMDATTAATVEEEAFHDLHVAEEAATAAAEEAVHDEFGGAKWQAEHVVEKSMFFLPALAWASRFLDDPIATRTAGSALLLRATDASDPFPAAISGKSHVIFLTPHRNNDDNNNGNNGNNDDQDEGIARRRRRRRLSSDPEDESEEECSDLGFDDLFTVSFCGYVNKHGELAHGHVRAATVDHSDQNDFKKTLLKGDAEELAFASVTLKGIKSGSIGAADFSVADGERRLDSYVNLDDLLSADDDIPEACVTLDRELADFDLDEYTRASWYVQQQQVNPYQSRRDLYCTVATYDADKKYSSTLYVPPDNFNPIGVYNYANRDEVNSDDNTPPALCSRETNRAGRLMVSPCFLPDVLAGPYWVLDVGNYSDGTYQWAIVSGGQPREVQGDGLCTTGESGLNSGLWILSREPELSADDLAAARASLEGMGVSTSKLLDVVQSGCFYEGAKIKTGDDDGATPIVQQEDEGLRISVPLEFGLQGIPALDTTLETWFYGGSLHNGFEGDVMTLEIPNYVNASISLTKNAAKDDDADYFNLGAVFHLQVLDDDGEELFKIEPSFSFLLDFMRGEITINVDDDLEAKMRWKSPVGFALEIQDENLFSAFINIGDGGADAQQEDEGLKISVPFEFGLRGIPDIDTTLETWFYGGSLHNGFDGDVMTLDIPDYVNASISLTKNAAKDDDADYFNLGAVFHLQVLDGDGEELFKIEPSFSFLLDFMRGEITMNVDEDVEAKLTWKAPVSFELAIQDETLFDLESRLSDKGTRDDDDAFLLDLAFSTREFESETTPIVAKLHVRLFTSDNDVSFDLNAEGKIFGFTVGEVDSSMNFTKADAPSSIIIDGGVSASLFEASVIEVSMKEFNFFYGGVGASIDPPIFDGSVWFRIFGVTIVTNEQISLAMSVGGDDKLFHVILKAEGDQAYGVEFKLLSFFGEDELIHLSGKLDSDGKTVESAEFKADSGDDDLLHFVLSSSAGGAEFTLFSLLNEDTLIHVLVSSLDSEDNTVASAELKANTNVDEVSSLDSDLTEYSADMTLDLKGEEADSLWNMDGQASFGWTSFHDDSRVQMAALGVLNANAKPLIYGRAGLDIDGNDILQASSETRASAVLDLNQSNYFTMKVVMKTDGDITGADNPERRLEETGPPKSMTCARVDMVMDDPMRIEGIDLNMTMETFIMNNARDFPRNFRGIVVEEHTSDIALREYPTEEFDKATECDANMRVAISMTSLASPPTPTAPPTPLPNYPDGYFVTDPAPWANCHAKCAAGGASFPCISNSAESADVLEALSERCDRDDESGECGAWIAVTDVDEEGVWQCKSDLASPHPQTFFNWGPGEPNNHEESDEDCVNIWGPDDPYARDGEWNDNGCGAGFLHCACYKEHEHGYCYSARSTVALKMSSENGAMKSRPIREVKVGDELYKKDSVTKKVGFTKVTGLHHSPTTQEYFHIKMIPRHQRKKVDIPHLLEATAHHTFPRCQTMKLAEARHIKEGDCLNTPHGDKLVEFVKKVPQAEAQQHETYTIITEGGERDLIAVGGVFAHASNGHRH